MDATLDVALLGPDTQVTSRSIDRFAKAHDASHYLLVPEAIRRSLRRHGADPRAIRALDRLVPAQDDEDTLRDIDAKRLLSGQGALARAFGRPLQPGRLAREMFVGELHPDIRALFDRMRRGMRALDAPALTEPSSID